VGTTFTALLPPASIEPVPEPPVPDEAEGGGWSPAPDGPHALRVLYVEDNEVNCLLIQEGLPMASRVQLRLAGSGAAALAAMRDERPDMLLMDMHMGDMTARELIAALEEEPSLRAIPRMLLTADAFFLAGSEVRRMGFLACLHKPVKLAELARAIDQYFPGTLRALAVRD
jgi:CheY-like chemotaxis protein